MNNRNGGAGVWYEYNGSDTTYVFVHGVLSDPEKCWRGSAYWPELVKTDSRLGRSNIFLAQYHTGLFSGDFDVFQCARQIFQSLVIPLDGHPPVMNGPRIIFVCHSLGGIITRELIEANFLRFVEKKVGLVLLASPSLGSAMANAISWGAALFGNKQAKNLRIGDEALTSLDNRFRKMLHEDRLPNLCGVEAVEHNGYVKWPLIRLVAGPIVKENSASRYFGAPHRLPDTDHSSIVKPADHEAESHRFLVAFVLDKFGPADMLMCDEAQDIAPGNEMPLLGEILFDSLNERSLPYYFNRSEDQNLHDVLKYYSVWIVGDSGVGKTSAARAQILSRSAKSLEICLSAYHKNFTVKNCIDEIAFVMETKRNIPAGSLGRTEQAIFFEIANLAGQDPFILYFDEVPPAGNDGNDVAFTEFVIRLINSMKDNYHNPNFKVLLSSIVAPHSDTIANGKAKERMRIFTLHAWSEESLGELLKLVIDGMKAIDHSFELGSIDVLVSAANGLPRELKNLVREKLLCSPASISA